MSGTTHMGTALKGAVMQIVPDSGWLGFESSHRAVSSNALMLSRLSSELRKTYRDLLDEPLPEHLVVFVRELEIQGRFAERWSGLRLFSRSCFESGSGGTPVKCAGSNS